MNLRDVSTEDLQRELELRELRGEYPEVKEPIDWSRVIGQAIARRDSVIDGVYHESNYDRQYMREAVMMAVFGKDYFVWENDLTD